MLWQESQLRLKSLNHGENELEPAFCPHCVAEPPCQGQYWIDFLCLGLKFQLGFQVNQAQLKLPCPNEKFQHFLKTVLPREQNIMTTWTVPFSKTAERLQKPLEALISLNFLESEKSQYAFTTGQMKIIWSQRHPGARHSSITPVALGTSGFLSLGRGEWLQYRSS